MHGAIFSPVVLDTGLLPWSASPMAGVERRLLDRCGGEVGLNGITEDSGQAVLERQFWLMLSFLDSPRDSPGRVMDERRSAAAS